MTFPFQTNQWYFVSISQSYHIFSKSQVEFYVDGHLKGKYPLTYPNINESFTHNCFANNFNEYYLQQPLIGQIGAVYLFSSVLPPNAISSMYELGPNLISEPQKGNLYTINEKLKFEIYFAYNPRAIEGALCLETSTGKKYLHATKLEGVREVKLRDISECVACAGGPSILFPLFTQLDLPLVSLDLDEEEKYSANPQNTISVIKLITIVLRESTANQEDVFKNYGFHLLGFLFQKVSPLCWSIDAINALEELSTAVLPYGMMLFIYISFQNLKPKLFYFHRETPQIVVHQHLPQLPDMDLH